jgi:predicted  nucleic acid-binding Zn-ribbon protein
MNAQEQILVALQELDTMLKEAVDSQDQFRRLGFDVSGVDELRRARTLLLQQLEPTHVQHYERMVERYGRAVTPVTGEMCLGCFATVPSVYRSASYHARVRMCQNCGRILYFP